MAKGTNANTDNVNNDINNDVIVEKKVQKMYEEWKVDVIYERNGEGKATGHSLSKVRMLKNNIKLDEWRIEDLNRQTENSKVHYYEQK